MPETIAKVANRLPLIGVLQLMVLRTKIVSEHIVCDFPRVQKRHFEKFEVALITNMVAVETITDGTLGA